MQLKLLNSEYLEGEPFSNSGKSLFEYWEVYFLRFNVLADRNLASEELFTSEHILGKHKLFFIGAFFGKNFYRLLRVASRPTLEVCWRIFGGVRDTQIKKRYI